MLVQCWASVADGGPTLNHIGLVFRADWARSDEISPNGSPLLENA